jgi:hypothetical protein
MLANVNKGKQNPHCWLTPELIPIFLLAIVQNGDWAKEEGRRKKEEGGRQKVEGRKSIDISQNHCGAGILPAIDMIFGRCLMVWAISNVNHHRKKNATRL